MSLSDAPRVIVTTFAGGATQTTDEWVVEVAEGQVGFWTPDDTQWRSRLAGSDVVTVQAATASGTADREQPLFEGRAEIVADGPTFDAIAGATREKYRIGSTVAGLLDRVREVGREKTPEAAIVIRIVG